MGLQEILQCIRDNSKAGDWMMFGQGVVRHAETKQCPMCWLASLKGCNPKGLKGSYMVVCGPLGVEPGLAYEIAEVADGHNQSDLRALLLEACHIQLAA